MQDPVKLWYGSWQLWMQMAEMMASAGTTIALRTAMMGQAAASGRMPPVGETMRMFSEKHEAMMEAASTMAAAAMRGDVSPEAAMSTASKMLHPYHKRTRSNAARLGRKLPS